VCLPVHNYNKFSQTIRILGGLHTSDILDIPDVPDVPDVLDVLDILDIVDVLDVHTKGVTFNQSILFIFITHSGSKQCYIGMRTLHVPSRVLPPKWTLPYTPVSGGPPPGGGGGTRLRFARW
jgi:hypothetical protein